MVSPSCCAIEKMRCLPASQPCAIGADTRQRRCAAYTSSSMLLAQCMLCVREIAGVQFVTCFSFGVDVLEHGMIYHAPQCPRWKNTSKRVNG